MNYIIGTIVIVGVNSLILGIMLWINSIVRTLANRRFIPIQDDYNVADTAVDGHPETGNPNDDYWDHTHVGSVVSMIRIMFIYQEQEWHVVRLPFVPTLGTHIIFNKVKYAIDRVVVEFTTPFHRDKKTGETNYDLTVYLEKV